MAASVEQALEATLSHAPGSTARYSTSTCAALRIPVADDLIARGAPFVFTTGYSAPIIPRRIGTWRCEKPSNRRKSPWHYLSAGR